MTPTTPPVAEERPDPPAPRPLHDPLTKRGEVWTVGAHRIMCGDCRSADDVAQLLGGATINVAFTSPPYAEQREYDESSGFVPIPPDSYVDWWELVQENVGRHLAADGSWFVNIKPAAEGLDTLLYVFDLVLAHVRRWGWHFGTEYAWQRTGVPRQVVRRFKNQFEPIYQFAKGPWKMNPDDVRHWSANVPQGKPDTSVENYPDLQGSGRSAILPRKKDPTTNDWSTMQGVPGVGSIIRGARQAPGKGPNMSAQQGQPGASVLPRRRANGGTALMSSVQGAVRPRKNGEAGAHPVAEDQQGAGQFQAAPGEFIGEGLAYPGNLLPTFMSSHDAVGHSAAFPVGLPAFFIKAYSDAGDAIFDPFVGSGSTIIAAHREGRVGYGMELSPAYVDIALARIQRDTGLVPELDGEPRDFAYLLDKEPTLEGSTT